MMLVLHITTHQVVHGINLSHFMGSLYGDSEGKCQPSTWETQV